MPNTGFRGSTGTGIGTEVLGVIGDGIGDEYLTYLGRENPQLIEPQKAVADKSNVDPLYQQARVECGGYDTCVTDRVAKLRAQKKATPATTKTRTGQHKQPQKTTQTSDYRGKGGVRATAA
ncbi:hypothetical protein ACFV1F_07915 [Streptomyces sp. NPDC059590]|uniref:hypothetical protein n=1 Tax=Streptomyces sp. NPDC059590 TaxID=3346877 RepID=UPI00368B914A